jgi:acyl carrier protein
MSDAITVISKSLQELGITASDIKPSARVQSDLRLDSTEAVQIALDLKKAFDLSIKLDFLNDPTLADLAKVVETQLSCKAV